VAVTSALSPLRTLMSWLCASLLAPAHQRWKAGLAMSRLTPFPAKPASSVPSSPASTRADGGDEVCA
jgi:hypothetical protein